MFTVRIAEARGNVISMGESTNPGAHVLNKYAPLDQAVLAQVTKPQQSRLGFGSRRIVYSDNHIEVALVTPDFDPGGRLKLEFRRRGSEEQFPREKIFWVGQNVAIGEFTPYPPDNPKIVGGELHVRRVITCEYDDTDGSSVNQTQPSPTTTLVA